MSGRPENKQSATALDADAFLRALVRLEAQDRLASVGSAAAVLLAVMPGANGLVLPFTHRAGNLRSHAGEVSLPGGRLEAVDDGSVTRAALREAEEEVGLPASAVGFTRSLPPCNTSRGLTVYPVVAWASRPTCWKLQREEVAAVVELPLQRFLDSANYREVQVTYKGVPKTTLSVDCDRTRVWGLTARIMDCLRRSLLLTDRHHEH